MRCSVAAETSRKNSQNAACAALDSSIRAAARSVGTNFISELSGPRFRQDLSSENPRQRALRSIAHAATNCRDVLPRRDSVSPTNGATPKKCVKTGRKLQITAFPKAGTSFAKPRGIPCLSASPVTAIAKKSREVVHVRVFVPTESVVESHRS